MAVWENPSVRRLQVQNLSYKIALNPMESSASVEAYARSLLWAWGKDYYLGTPNLEKPLRYPDDPTIYYPLIVYGIYKNLTEGRPIQSSDIDDAVKYGGGKLSIALPLSYTSVDIIQLPETMTITAETYRRISERERKELDMLLGLFPKEGQQVAGHEPKPSSIPQKFTIINKGKLKTGGKIA